MLIRGHGECAVPEACPQTPYRRPSAWDDARAIAYLAATALPPSQVALAEAVGGVLAEPLRAVVSVPLVNCSAMDGYAVCGPSPWSVVACLRAGEGVPPLLPVGNRL